MRASVSAALLLLGAGCANSVRPVAQPEPSIEPGTIAITSARLVSNCGTVGVDVTARFRQACEGKWRCAVQGDLATQVAALSEAVAMPGSDHCPRPAFNYEVSWRCDGTSGEHSLKVAPTARLRLSCPRADGRADDDLAVTPVTSSEPAAPGTSGDKIRGRLVGSAADGVAGRTVEIGRQRTSTQRTGSFSLNGVPAGYDIVVTEPDGSGIAVYLGLSRREPVVAHWQLPPWPRPEPRRRYRVEHEATISGRLWGSPVTGDRLPATVRFLPAEPTAKAHTVDERYDDVDYAFDGISWSGRPALSGRLMATIYPICPGPDCALIGIASKRVALEDGDNLSEDLQVVEPAVGHVAGTWQPGEELEHASLRFTYRLDGGGSVLAASCALAQSFDCALPDLRFLAGQYCASVAAANRPEQLLKCGIPLGTTDLAVSGNLPKGSPPPESEAASAGTMRVMKVISPDAGESVTPDSLFAWQARPGSVYVVDLRPNLPFSLVPRILVFTGKTSLRWRDLVGHGIAFPAGASYGVTVSSLPVGSVDQLASLEWWYRSEPVGQGDLAEPTRITLVDPAAPTADPKAPSNVREMRDFPLGLPTCRTPMKGQALDTHSIGKVVTVTGILYCGQQSCLPSWPPKCQYGCELANVAGSSSRIAIYAAHLPQDKGRLPPMLAVAATGRLVLYPIPDGLALEEANLCLTAR